MIDKVVLLMFKSFKPIAFEFKTLYPLDVIILKHCKPKVSGKIAIIQIIYADY